MALTKVSQLMIADDAITLAEFGAVGDGATNDYTAIQAALTYASANNVPIVDFSNKTYNYGTTLNVGSVRMYGNFTLNGTGSAFLNITGSLTEIGYVDSAASKGDSTVTLSSVSGLSEDDIIILWNSTTSSYSPHRTNYYDGEFSRILSISGSDVELESILQTSYSAASTNKVYKLNDINVVIDGPSFTGSGTFAIRVQYASNSTIKPELVETTGTSAALVVNKSYKVLVQGGRYSIPYDASGGNYGISVSNSQYVTIKDVDAFGGRHAVATGGDDTNGSVPCRFINIKDSVLANDPASNVYCADFHGNTIDSKYSNCVVYGSVGLGGERVAIEDSEVHGLPNSGNVMLGYQELVKSSVTFKNINAHVGDGMTAFAVVGNLGASLVNDISGSYQVIVDNVFANINASVTTLVNAYESSGEANSWTIKDIGFGGTATGLDSVIKVTISGSGVDPSYVRISDLNFQLVNNYSVFELSGTTLSSTDLYLPTLVDNNPPTSGYHVRNQIVYRQPAAAGTSIGWVCTASGTPGTWKSFGSIAS